MKQLLEAVSRRFQMAFRDGADFFIVKASEKPEGVAQARQADVVVEELGVGRLEPHRGVYGVEHGVDQVQEVGVDVPCRQFALKG